MSECSQTERRFEKLQQTFNRLIEQNSHKNLRQRIEDQGKRISELERINQGLVNTQDAHLRIIKTLEEDKKQIRDQDTTSAQES